MANSSSLFSLSNCYDLINKQFIDTANHHAKIKGKRRVSSFLFHHFHFFPAKERYTSGACLPLYISLDSNLFHMGVLPMNASAFGQKTPCPNQNNFKWTLPSEEELKFQIEQLEGTQQDEEIRFKRLIVGAAYIAPFLVLTLFANWFAGH